MLTQLSPNIMKTDEEYLLCKNVKIAHTQPMQYYIKTPDSNKPRMVFISNSSAILDDAFCSQLIGKPLVNNHPNEKVNSKNYFKYMKGIILDAYAKEGNLVADILVYDKNTQDEIFNGKREVSIDVSATLTKIGENEYIKNPVSFNHLALVDKGRAGREYRFIDSEDIMENQEQTVSVPVSFFEKLFGKKEDKKDKQTFSDKEDIILSLKEEVAKLSERLTNMEKSLEEKQSFSDTDDDLLIPSICEFMPFRKGMNLEMGVKSAVNSAVLSSVGASVEKMLNGRDAFTLSFQDAKNILISAFEMKKAINTPTIHTTATQQKTNHTIITGADLNKLYDGE